MDVLRKAGTAVVGDALDRLGGATGLIRYDRAADCLAGPALTVQTRAGDNLAIYEALTKARPGDVLVVDGGGCLERALVGDLAREYAIKRGITGFIIDGAIRDVLAFRGEDAFACFARGASHRGPTKNGPGRVGVPVAIGDQIVSPGDIVLADDDGLVCVAAQSVDSLSKVVTERLAHERLIRAEILTGRVEQSWIEAAFAAADRPIS